MAIDTRTDHEPREMFDPIADDLKRDGVASLRFSPPTVELLDRLAGRLNLPMGEVLTRALLLLSLAAEAQERGEQVCFVDGDSNIVGEVGDIALFEDGEDEGYPADASDPSDQ